MEVTLADILTLLVSLKESVDTAETIPPELAEVLETFGDSEQGNNDVENILIEIRDSLKYDPVLDDDNTSALSEISQRLEVVDTRLDIEFNALNTGVSVIMTCCVLFLVFKFFSWVERLVAV